ncbi:[Colletotrichum costaricense]|uniref:ATP synthase F0 n=2 Tax=Colletotrichum acutatum species complex TaxID=2707335 RepID=A0AAJ0DZK8_9PEZI|nr:[Colletotrichum costaricense] [Colletotrichum costaricense]XP_060375192.1 [Colletotrichum tamarilloi] [Colletotrichum tamarilloi]KAI3542611.1 ATP synthase F0 [Colletotrichum filicis]KAK1480751.1 ATP synthase F0 [Colletotrichum tamarilloi]KAK1525968.1 ATP synthase F0 [Colletotrichum costaricense]
MGWVLNATPEVEAISQWPTIIAVVIVLSVLSVIVVGSRIWIRFSARGLAADDWMSILSEVFALIYSGLTIAQTRYGLGLPIKLRPKDNLILYTRINFAGRPFYQLGISFFKIALLISYLRLLKGTDQKNYRRIVWLTIILVFIAHLGCSFSLVFACTPVDKSWNPLKAGTCLPAGPSFTAYAVVTIISDVVVAVLPIPVLLKLNVRVEKKAGLIAIFLLGLFTTLCSILRYLEINRIQYGDGNSTMLVLWGTIEFNVGNIVSSLPFLAPVCMKKAKNYRSKYSGGSSHGRSHLKGAERYKLSEMNHDKSVFASANHSKGDNGSEENILPGNIMKSVTYSVQVDDRVDSKPGMHGGISGGTRRRDSRDSDV